MANRRKRAGAALGIRRHVGAVLAGLFLTSSTLPGVMVLAAPQIFVRPGSGVSGTPLGVTAFASPQFGEIADAVNVATGNVYYDVGALNRNNLNKTGDDAKSFTGGARVTGVMRLNGFNTSNATVPQEWSLALGDGSYQLYAKTTDVSSAPTWIKERYQALGTAVNYYIAKPVAGVQTDEQWLVFYKLANGRMIAHHYDHDGQRTSFYNDGEYADYTQSLHQQYRSAKYQNDPEGFNSAAKTYFSYTSATNGHVRKIRDEWGRVTLYDWNDSLNQLKSVSMLLQDENDPNSWKRRIEYVYDQIGSQYFVSFMVQRTFDGQNKPIGRWFDLNYTTDASGRVLLSQVGKPRVVDQAEGNTGGLIYTTYKYDSNGRVTEAATPGEKTINFDYGTASSPETGGLKVTQTQGDKKTTYEYTPDGWLRNQVAYDFNPLTGYKRDRLTQYWYDGAGRVLALNMPSGAQIQSIYDRHGNKTQESIYKSQVAYAVPAPSSYLRTTTFEYDRDNQLTNSSSTSKPPGSANSGTVNHDWESTETASYNYKPVTHPQVRGYFETSAGNQAFRALSGHNDDLYVNGGWVSAPNYLYDEYGRMTSVKSHAAGTPVKVTTYTYAPGNVDAPVKIPDDNGNPNWSATRTIRNYGDQIRSTTEHVEDVVVGQSGQDKRTDTYYDEYGNLTWISRPDAYVSEWVERYRTYRTHETLMAYNGFGQKTWQYELSQPGGGGNQVRPENIQVWIYYTSGELRYVFQGTGDPSRPMGSNTIYYYAANGLLNQSVEGRGLRGSERSGKVQTTLLRDDYGRVAKSIVNDKFTTTYSYDTFDREVQVVQPDGGVINRSYKGPMDELYYEELVDPASPATKTYVYHDRDSLGREFRTVTTGWRVVDTIYDPFDRPIRITDLGLTMNKTGKDQATYLVYDDLGRLIKKLDPALVTNPESNTPYTDARRPYHEYDYDWRGRPVKTRTLLFGGIVSPENMVMPSGAGLATTAIEYDGYDRPIKVTDEAGYATTTEYDRSDHPVEVTRRVWNGTEEAYNVAKVDADFTITRNAYDAADHLIQVQSGLGRNSYADYDVQGNLVMETDERGIVTKAYQYSSDNLLENVWEPDNNMATSAQRGTVTLANLAATHVVTEANFYDEYSGYKPRTATRAYMNAQAGSDTGAQTDYTYDYAGRVLTTTLPPDQNGQRAVLEQKYDVQGHMIYQRDVSGFVTKSSYNALGQLASTVSEARPGNAADQAAGLAGGLTSTYQYDASGNLILKNERNLITEYRYNSLGKVIHESRPRIDAGTGTNWKKTTYRLDGLATAKTSYSYTGKLTSKPDVVLAGDGSVTVDSGNLTLYEYNGRGDLWAEWSLAKNRAPESQMWQRVNGLGQRYQRAFIGDMGIYAEQKSNGVTPLGHANSLSYWRYDVGGNLIEKWDTPMNGNGWTLQPLDLNDKQNYFSYRYDAANREVQQERNIQIRQQSKITNNQLYTTYGGSQGVLLAASLASTDTTYNERGSILRTTTTDNTPFLSGSGATIPRQDQGGGMVKRHQQYSYYLDGRTYKSETGDGTAVQKNKTSTYDQRGREIKVVGSIGQADTSYYPDGRTTTSITVGGKVTWSQESTPTLGGLTAMTKSGNPSDPKVYTPVNYVYGDGVEDRVWKTIKKGYNVVDTYDIFSYTALNENTLRLDTTNPSSPSSGDVSFYYEYDPDGHLTREYWDTNGTTHITAVYQLDSRGNRLSVKEGELKGYVKLYDPDQNVAEYNNTSNNQRSTTFCGVVSGCRGVGNRYNSFRYDPYGQQALTSTAQIEEQNDQNYLAEHGVWRDWNSIHSVQGQVQLIVRKAGAFVRQCGTFGCSVKTDSYRSETYKFKDASYSVLEGSTDQTAYTGTYQFATFGSVQQLDAPVQSLSSTLKINPLDIATPTLPRLPDPSQIIGPQVETQDVPLGGKIGADQGQKQVVNDVTVNPGKVSGASQNPNPSSANEQVLTLDVAPDFDDGQGFSSPIYAVSPLSIVVNPSSTAAPDNTTDYQAKKKADEDKELADRAAKAEEDARKRLARARMMSNQKESIPISKLNDALDNVKDAFDAAGAPPATRLEFYQKLIEGIDTNKIGQKDIVQMGANAYKFTSTKAWAQVKENFPPNQIDFVLSVHDYIAYNYAAMLGAPDALNNNRMGFTGLDKASGRLGRLNPDAAGAIIDDGLDFGLTVSSLGLYGLGRLSLRGAGVLAAGLRESADGAGEAVWAAVTRGCRLNSFTPATPIRTLSGLVAISALTIGTPVLAFNESTGESGYYPITAVHQNVDPAITYLTLNDGKTNQPEAITTTPEHPFYVTQPSGTQPKPIGHEDLNEHWVGAGHLQIGDKIREADGSVGTVANVVTVQQTQEMFNLTVDEAHTFYVGQDGWLVHNAGGSPVLPTATDLRAWAGKQGYTKSMSGNIEVWSDSSSGEWRLKIKPPSQHTDIHEESKEYRYSARNAKGEYFDPISGQTGTRKTMGHLSFDPCDF